MHDPYAVLGVDPGTEADSVRQRYLKLIREFPPDRAPEKFAEIRAAFERIQNPEIRLNELLFEPPPHNNPLTRIIDATIEKIRTKRLPTAVVLSLARNDRGRSA